MMRFVHIFAVLGKYLIYPTLGEICIFLKQPNSLEQFNKQILEQVSVFTLGRKNRAYLPYFWQNKNLNKLEKNVMG